MALELGSHGIMPLDFSSGAREGISGSQSGSPPGSSAFTIVTPKGMHFCHPMVEIEMSPNKGGII